ncbi:putative outer membrane receptor protein, partial [Vibrio parahaemolyticus B-265]
LKWKKRQRAVFRY